MRKTIVICLILSAAMSLLVGCNGGRDADQLAYVLAIGVDKAEEDGKFLVTFQIATPNVPGEGSGGGGGGSDAAFVNTTVQASAVTEARNIANSYVARSISFIHVKVIVVGEELAREGVGEALAALMRFREFRGSMFILVSRGKAQEFLQANRPKLEKVISKHYELIFTSTEETGFYLKTFVHEFYNGLKNGSISPAATLVGINPLNLQGQESDQPDPGEMSSEYYAGQIPRIGENPITYHGLAVFRGDKLVGFLSSEEARMVDILRNKFTRGYLNVDDPVKPGSGVTVNIRQGANTQTRVQVVNKKAKIHVKVFLEGEIIRIASGVGYEQGQFRDKLDSRISQVVKQSILKMIERTQEYGSDVVGFGYQARTQFLTNKEFESAKWFDLYKDAEVEVEVTTRIRRTGLMRKTLPIIK